MKKCRAIGMPIRVLLFDHVAALSGGEIALVNMVRHFDRAIVQPIILLGESGPLLSHIPDDIEVHILPMAASLSGARKDTLGLGSLMRVTTALKMLRYIFTLAAFIREHKIDIIHTNSLKADVIGGLAGRLARTKILWHVRDRIADDYLPATVVSFFQALCSRIPHTIIANSGATAATLGVRTSRRKNIIVVHDGINVDAYVSEVVRTERSEMTVGLVGRISPWKGQDIFIRAAALVRQTHSNVRFRIIGSALFGEAEYERNVRSLVKDLGLTEAVTFVGFIDDIAAEVKTLDIIVHASTRPEPFGQVIIEGMAAAVPVVATAGGGVLEIIKEGITGLLVPMNSHQDMASAILWILDNQSMAQEMGRQGRLHVEQNFTIQRTSHLVERVYESMSSVLTANLSRSI